jgi:hypothetical protein
MPPCQLDLFPDEIKVIEQPFRRRRDVAGAIDRRSGAIEGLENLFILIQPCQQAVTCPFGRDLVLLRNGSGMGNQLIDG